MESDPSSTAVESIHSVGFWLSFALIIVVSASEALASIFWTRIRVTAMTTADGEPHGSTLSIRVCGREIIRRWIDTATAQHMAARAAEGRAVACTIVSHVLVQDRETVIDSFGSPSMVTRIAIRQFDPSTSLAGASGLVNNFMELNREDENGNVLHLENVVHLLVGLVDISLGIAGLVLIPSAPQKLWDTLQDVTAPMTLENYLTLFFLWWILGVLLFIALMPLRSIPLLVAMLPLHSQVRSIQRLVCLGLVATVLVLMANVIAAMASLVLFGLGCWKIDYARRNGLDWTPILSYWIGGASAIQNSVLWVRHFHDVWVCRSGLYAS